MKRFLLPGLAAVCVLMAPGALRAQGRSTTLQQELQAAQAALAAGHHDEAWPRYRRLAERGNALAQFVVGQFLQQGWDRPVDQVAACNWFSKAAGQRVPYAEHLWADCLAQGTVRKPDIVQALNWYERAAEDGHWLSLCAAARYHIRGQGVAQDVPRGLAMCTRAAQAESPPAMLQLARYYQQDADVPQNLPGARYWYEQAARRQQPEAQYRLGLMLAQGQGGPADPDTALHWLERAASAGYAEAYLPTAVLYGNADVQADTGALAPAHLAKVYLWAAAAKASHLPPPQQALASSIESQALAIMPPPWLPELNRQIAEHLARFAPP